MTRNHNANRTQDATSTLEEIDLGEMEKVSGGCQQCASGNAAARGNQLSALAPMLANQAPVRR